MENTLFVNDFVLITGKFRKKNQFDYYDVCFFSTNLSRGNFVKRIIALPGDSVRIENTRIFVNGRIFNSLTNIDERIFHIPVDQQRKTFETIDECIVKDNCYFLIGDNIYSSIDSRHFGPVPEENIVGKATFILFNYQNGKFRWNRFLKRIE